MIKTIDPKPNFPEKERKLLELWYSSGLVEKYLKKNAKSKKKFFFLDGPITANNPMGVHHAWGRTYKDVWQRYFNMKGFKQRFQNGFDCQGLWVEVEVEKELGLKNKKDIENLVLGDKKASIAKFVELCKERVKKYAGIQTEQSKRLGYFMDWDNSYFTNSDENNYMIWYFLKKCHEKRLLYKGHDSVPWCYRCGIAISQHEILTEDYQDLTHETIFFKLSVNNQPDTYLLLWTTTPWTIPANVAVAYNTQEKYVLVEHDSEKLILMKKRYEFLKKDLPLGKIIKELSPEELNGLFYQAPFDHLPRVKKVGKKTEATFHRVYPGKFKGDELVTSDEGTGLLHVAPGAGEEDFQLGKILNLGVIDVIDEEANYLEGMEEFTGKNAKIHPELIIDYLQKKEEGRFFLQTMSYTHRYPVCWRCKTELVWRVVDEWYIKMSEELREQMRKVVKNIRWIPDFGKERELDWITNMHDWLISKKRYYGLCLPIYECGKCHSFEVIGSKEELKQKAVAGWKEFDGHSPHRPWVDEVKIKCPSCGSVLSRISDVGNVWLDAGIVTFSTLVDSQTGKVSYMTDQNYFKEWYPADFITESFPGQFKNWFYSLIVMSTVLENHQPTEAILGYASLLGEDGKPMHKSNKKTFVSFDDGAEKIGVDVLRWLYLTHDPSQNLLFGFHVADEVRRRFHLLLWNIFNFFLTYYQLNKTKNLTTINSQNILDRWIRNRLRETVQIATQAMDQFDAYTATVNIEKFVNDLSLWYVRRSRDRVSPTNPDKNDLENCLATQHEVLLTLARLLAPFLPFLSEEIYQTLQGSRLQREDSVHLSDWPKLDSATIIDTKLNETMSLVRKLCEVGHSQRKALGIKVRQPLSSVTVTSPNLSSELSQLILDELNVKTIIYKPGKTLEVTFDTKLTSELIAEGQARELVRKIQDERKKLGCSLDEKVEISLPDWPEEFTKYLKEQTLATKISKGEFAINRKS